MHCRTLWLSDIHLGTPECRAGDLLEFLDRVSTERLYLVGDIIDLEQMRSDAVFPETHRLVLERIFALAIAGTEVVYVPGNHDAVMRKHSGRDIMGIEVCREAVHRTARGQRLLVTHGDRLDGRIRRGTRLGRFGASAYRLLIRIDVSLNRLREQYGGSYFPLSARVKQRIRLAEHYIRRFEQIAAEHARERGFDGIVCGHIHRPCLRTIDGVRYANDGDWVEHRTALAEFPGGDLRLLHFDRDLPAANVLPVATAAA